jgi:hypothetical protein
MTQTEPIVIMDSSEILEGKLEELRTAIKELVEFVESNEPRTIAYNVYFSEDGARMTVAQIHADSASMEYHMKTAGPAFPKFKELIRLSTMDIYGKPSDRLRSRCARRLGCWATRPWRCTNTRQVSPGLEREQTQHERRYPASRRACHSRVRSAPRAALLSRVRLRAGRP